MRAISDTDASSCLSSQLDADFCSFPPLRPAPPSYSTRGERSSAHRKIELNEQAGQRDDEKLRRGQDGILEGHMDNELSSVPSVSPPPHSCNRGEYRSTEYLPHDQHEEDNRLGASTQLESQSWGGVRPSGHHCDRVHWSTPCPDKERPPHDPGASTPEQYKPTPQYRPQEKSHSSPHRHSYDYSDSSYGHYGHYEHYAPPGYQYRYYAQADTYNHYNNPHYHPSHQQYYQHWHSYYYPPPAYPSHNGGQCHSPSQTYRHEMHDYYQTSTTGWASEEEAGQDKQAR